MADVLNLIESRGQPNPGGGGLRFLCRYASLEHELAEQGVEHLFEPRDAVHQRQVDYGDARGERHPAVRDENDISVSEPGYRTR